MTIGKCWICNIVDELTGEHKFKASDLRNQFGKERMYKFEHGAPFEEKTLLQGAQSKYAKFTPSICAKCNNDKTQAADEAYDILVKNSQNTIAKGQVLESVWRRPPFENKTSREFVDAFRYFGKLLGCHIVNVGLPVPEKIRKFVNNETDNISIWLKLFEDTTIKDGFSVIGEEYQELEYTAHGGLIVPCDKKTAIPKRFLSTQTVGKAGFEFWSNIDDDYLQLHYFKGLPLWNLTQESLKRDGYLPSND